MPVRIEDIITRNVTDEQIAQAISIRADRDKLYGNIYEEVDTDMRWVGDLGEIIVNELFSMCTKGTTDWHLEDVTGRADFNFCGFEIDVKTVKRKVPIKPWYTSQITAKHAKTPMDYIVFACYEFPEKKMHILGAIKKTEFMENADYCGEGHQVHPNYTIRKGHEIYNMTISKFTPFRDFVRMALKSIEIDIAA